jgi:eukaryotic-like serine/threonine-protein kinase
VTARREPSPPPRLPGCDHVRLLGLGGFADVFLYHQDLPSRDVAVKVLLAGSLDDDVRGRFRTEANLMAQLSHHPSIVTIYHADIAADGRPYLVMEYCSRPGLAERYRTERISVAEALRIGIRLASAVETAHRAGILHRDIKPANVLTTDFGWPALTDFGIAATAGPGGSATVGMSIPWSPPELLGAHPTGDERSDVYSLAATVYSLLAGRTPFELPGGQNNAQQLVARIERAALPQTGRDDVPASLQQLLDRAMSKHPARRFPSAAAFGRALQQVEAELRLPVTPLDLLDEPTAAPVPEPASGAVADDATRLRSIVAVPQVASPTPAPAEDERTRLRPVHVAAEPQAGPRFEAPVEAPVPAPAAQAGNRRLVAGIMAGLVVVAAALGVAAAARHGSHDASPHASETAFGTARADDPAEGAVPAPASLGGLRQSDGSVVFTWENPDPQPGDKFLWGVRPPTGEPTLALVDAPTVTVPAEQASGQVCVEVSLVRADRRASTRPVEGCVS